jgi:hypothetical protein
LLGGWRFFSSCTRCGWGRITAQGLPDNYSNPVLALELVKDGAGIKEIMESEEGRAREFVRRSTYKDFGYICVYALFFILLSLLLSQMNFSWARWVGLLAAACAALAAVLDLVEDRGMLKAAAAPTGSATDSLADSIRYPSLAKWAFLFIFSLLVGLLLIARRDAFVIPALCFLVASLLGLSGVVFNLLRPKFYWMFPAAMAAMGIAVVILSVALTFCPDKLLNKFLSLTS